jgi:hypothetical protein
MLLEGFQEHAGGKIWSDSIYGACLSAGYGFNESEVEW